MADIEIDVMGQGVGGTMTLKLDWAVLGGLFAEATGDEQADFLDAVQTGFGDFASIAAELTQFSRIAEAVPVQSLASVRNWVQRLGEALEEDAVMPEADAVALANEGARRVFCLRCERGHEGPCRG